MVNQVPVASQKGIIGSGKMGIDLVQKINENKYIFYELKVDQRSGHPFAAAIQIMIYAIFYLFRRKDAEINGKDIDLVVLAPYSYYLDWGRDWERIHSKGGNIVIKWEKEIKDITDFINEDIKILCKKQNRDESFNFYFENFDKGYDEYFKKSKDEFKEFLESQKVELDKMFENKKVLKVM